MLPFRGRIKLNSARTIEIKLKRNRNETAKTFHGCFVINKSINHEFLELPKYLKHWVSLNSSQGQLVTYDELN